MVRFNAAAFSTRIAATIVAVACLAPAAGAQVEGAPPAADAAASAGAKLTECLPASEIDDRDGDIRRNRSDLSSTELCINQDEFKEGGLRWQLRIIQNKKRPDTVFWMVPHDNETDAFDSAVYGVRKYGGTVVAVETGGNRYNGPQDPNRNFDAGTGLKCREQVAPSPIYTEHVMRWWTRGSPILALHTNDPGGGISISKPLPGAFPFRTAASLGKVPDHTMIFVASSERPENNASLMQFVKQLNQKGINVQYELVSRTHNDCSMSNYASLKGIPEYVNIEVVQTDGTTQRHIIDLIMPTLAPGIEPGKPTAPEVAAVKPVKPTPEVAAKPSKPTAAEVAAVKTRPARGKVEETDEEDDEARPPASKPEGRPAAPACVADTRQAKVAAGTIKLPPTSDADPPGSQILVQLAKFPDESFGKTVVWPIKLKDFGEILSHYKPISRTLKTDSKWAGLFVGPFATEDDASTVCNCLKNVGLKGDPRSVCTVTRN